MTNWFGVAAAVLLTAGPALAADVATCTLGADKKTVTVTASNPYSQVMACEVNCNMAMPGGFSTISCAKLVPVGAKDFVMCTDTAASGHTYTRVKDVEVRCPDPSAPPAASKASGDDDGDDAKDDAKTEAEMQKMMKQGQEMLKQLKQK